MGSMRLLIVGASGHGVVALEAALATQSYEVVGWLDSYKTKNSFVHGRKIFGGLSELHYYVQILQIDSLFVAISNNYARAMVSASIINSGTGASLASIVHPFSYVSTSAKIGPGSLVLPGAVVHSRVAAGLSCVFNTNSSLDHDCVIGDYVSLLPGVTVAGNVAIGDHSCLCMNSTVSHGVVIGSDSYIGANSLVLDNIPGYSLAYGSPASRVRARMPDEKHF